MENFTDPDALCDFCQNVVLTEQSAIRAKYKRTYTGGEPFIPRLPWDSLDPPRYLDGYEILDRVRDFLNDTREV